MLAWFVELPSDVQAQIGALVLLAVSFLLTQLVLKIPFLAFLLVYKNAIAAALAAGLIMYIQNYSPDKFGVVIVLAIRLVLALIGLVIVIPVFKAIKNKLLAKSTRP